MLTVVPLLVGPLPPPTSCSGPTFSFIHFAINVIIMIIMIIIMVMIVMIIVILIILIIITIT